MANIPITNKKFAQSIAPDFENLKFPQWLPAAVKEQAADYLKLRTRKPSSKQGKVTMPKSLQVMLLAEHKKCNAIINLVTHADMKNLWMEIENKHPQKISELLDAVAIGYSRWNAQDTLLPHEKKAKIKQITSLIKDLQKAIHTDFKLGFEIQYLYGKLIEEKINETLASLKVRREKQKIDTSNLSVTQKFLYDDQLTRMVGLVETLGELVEALKREEKTLCNPPSQKNILFKKRAENAERTYFVPIVAKAVKDIFGKKRYKDVANILAVMNPDWIITEDHIRKLVDSKNRKIIPRYN
jgi:hypothetical protein